MLSSKRVVGVSLASLMIFAATAVGAMAGATTTPFQDSAVEALIGEWEMVTQFQGQEIPATMIVSMEDGDLVGVWRSMGEDMPMSNISVEEDKLSFNRPMGMGGSMLLFEGTIEGDTIAGKWVSDMGGEYVCTGTKKK